MNFFSELKRPNVYKLAVAYAVMAWLIQAASILFPTFEAPPWVMKGFVAVIMLGFPIALVFSWAFEITPEGIKREEDVAPNESITHHTGRKNCGYHNRCCSRRGRTPCFPTSSSTPNEYRCSVRQCIAGEVGGPRSRSPT